MAKPHFGVTIPQIKRPWVAAAEAARSFEAMGFRISYEEERESSTIQCNARQSQFDRADVLPI